MNILERMGVRASRFFSTLICGMMVLLTVKTIDAQTADVFPESTKAFLTISNAKELGKKIELTSFGKMMKQPEVKAFTDSLVKEVMDRVNEKSDLATGLEFKNIEAVASGRISIGLIQPEENQLGFITLAEISDSEAVDAMLAKVKKKLLAKGAKEIAKIKEGSALVTHYEFKDPFGIAGPPQVFYGRTDKHLISYYGPVLQNTDKVKHTTEVRKLLGGLQGKKIKSLANRTHYKETMKGVFADGKYAKNEIQWYFDAFGFIDAAQKIWPEKFDKEKYGAYRRVGFDGIKSLGGVAVIEDGKREFLVRGFVYAPRADEKNRFLKAAKMLDFTDVESRHQSLPDWITKTNSSYMSAHANMSQAFENAKYLVDELFGADTFEGFIAGLNHPRQNFPIDVRKEFVAQLNNRVIAIRDPVVPAKADKQRVAVAVELKSEKKSIETARKGLKKYFGNEKPDQVKSKKIKVGPGKDEIEIHIYLTFEEAESGGDPDDIDDLDLDLDCGGGDAYQNTLQDDLDEELAADAKLPAGVLSETGFAVYKGYLFISQDVQFLEELLQRAANSTKSELPDEKWFKEVNAELDKVKSDGFESLRYAFRLDLPYKAVYELVRKSKGELPIETTIKRLLEEKGDKRLVDVTKLPKDFDKSISPFLNNGGWTISTEPNGWILNGVIVGK